MQTITHAIRKLHLTQTNQTLLFVSILFCLPLFLSGPQLLVGSLVNFFLIGATGKLSRSKAWPLAFLPSIAAVLHGVIFGPFTIFLVYMMPAIWIGNLILMYAVSHFSRQRLGILTGSVVKVLFLFLVAFLLFHSALLPKIFLTAMGIMQFATVLIGGSAYLLLRKKIS
ncbi:MAG: hypothetical protein WC875_00140 [Candidatus Absconditabacterales bacterium]